VSDQYEFAAVDRITFGALGPPGRRTFYLQARSGLDRVTLLVEKDHVIALSEGTEEIFKSAGYPEESIEWDADSMALEEPVEPAFRVGTMAIGYAEDRDLVLIECRPPADADPDVDPDADVDPDVDPALGLGGGLERGPSARFWITREQLEALSAYGMIVAAQGRPICPLCRVPMEPDGHECFASNGHRTEV
jgi:uncharacterized repeat protein (TIGR03847 family)